jgi:DNA-binding transcriptional LysR family regulator
MDLNDIVVFTKVAETRSFTAAAQLIGIPKSTVSRRVAQLEERLGVRLVHRNTRKVSLTAIGEAYYERCVRIVTDIALSNQIVTDMQDEPRGLLRVTAPVDFSTACLGPVIAAFIAQYPEITVELEGSDRVADLLEDGFDIAVRFAPPTEEGLGSRRLTEIAGGLVAAPVYLAQRGAPTFVDELDEHDRLLFLPSARYSSWTLTDGAATYEFGRPARFVSNNLAAVRRSVLAGAGIASLTDFSVARDLAAGTLVRVLPEWRGRPIEAHLVYPARERLPPRLQLFIEHMSRAFSQPS